MLLRAVTHVQRLAPNLPCCHQAPLRLRFSNYHQVFRSRSSRLFADTPQSRQTQRVPRYSAPQTPRPGHTTPAFETESALLNKRAKKRVQDGQNRLYKASSHFGYMYAGWIGGGICFGQALLIMQEGLFAPNEELHWLIPVAYRIIIIFLGFVGSWAISRSSRLISSIDVLPGQQRPLLRLRIRRNIPLPFINPRVITVPISNVEMGRRVVALVPQSADSARLEQADSGQKLRLGTRLNMAIFRFFAGFRQWFNSDGLVNIYIKGYRGSWKMDAYGFVLHGGAPLYELVTFRED